MKVAITGHRPKGLKEYNWNIHSIYLTMEKILVKLKPEIIISGMALGADQMAAKIAIDNNIPLLAVIPFEGQEDKWTKYDANQYHQLLEKATEIEILNKHPQNYYDAVKMLHGRNKWMVDHADLLLAIWNNSGKGGTANCVRYAKRVQSKKNFNIIQIDTATRKISLIHE